MRSTTRIDPPLRVGLPLIILIDILSMADLHDQRDAAYSSTAMYLRYIRVMDCLTMLAVLTVRNWPAYSHLLLLIKWSSNFDSHLHGCSLRRNTCGALLCNVN